MSNNSNGINGNSALASVYQSDSDAERARRTATEQANQKALAAAPPVTTANGTPVVNPTAPNTPAKDSVGGVAKASAPTGGVVNTAAPVLPDVEGEKASAKAVSQVVTGGALPTNTGGMAWASMEAMTEGAQQEFTQQSKVKRDAEQQKVNDKGAEIKDTKTQIAGQRQQSVDLFAGSLAATVVSGGLGAAGAKLAFTGEGKRMIFGQAAIGMGQSSGQLINNMASMSDKEMGGGREADDAGIEIKVDQKAQDIDQQVADSANTLVQNSQQEWQKAQQAITDMNDRKMQAVNQVANS